MQLFKSVALATAVLVMTLCNARAGVTSLVHTIEISGAGDATHRWVLALDAESYTRFKANTTNVYAFIYNRLALGMGWEDFEKFQSTFDDAASSVTLEFIEYGFTRPVKGDKWSTSSTNNSLASNMIEADKTDTRISLTGVLSGGAISLVKIVAPRGAHSISCVPASRLVTYTLPVVDGTGNDIGVEMAFQSKDEIMSCAAKAYASRKFPQLWIARNLFKNTGFRVLKNYRTRWRLVDYSPWSAWEHSATVVPGQTVVDAFYPIIDLAKVAALTGPVTAALETEYEYRRPDGETVRESDSHRITILARNQLVFSSIPQEKIVGFHGNYANGPLALASFVTHNDPVVQQLAGWLSDQGGRLSASGNNKDAIKFMELLYSYIGNSHIAYQTPPGGITGGKNYQHVKYARDVLLNRAGTCIDLAILYASVAKAVGLRPVMFLVPGHCFAAVLLPEGGGLFPIEATMTGHADFNAAYQKALEEVRQARNSGLLYEVNICNLQNSGVDALELAAVPVDYLEKLGYTRTTPSSPTLSQTPNGPPPKDPGGLPTPSIHIYNPLVVTIKYELMGGVSWMPWEAKPAGVNRHWRRPMPNGEVPHVVIQFNADMGSGVNIVTRTLQAKLVQDALQDGAPYHFNLSGNNVLEIYQGKAPGQ